MDQDLKQRLVGAVVITSLAAIFIPMLFDDPIDETGKMINELKIPHVPSITENSESNVLAQKIEDVVNLPVPSRLTKQSLKQQPVSEMNRWFLQVGIFSQRSNAVLLQNTIRKQGYPVKITEVIAENGPLYRVKVGPELDKKRAEDMKEKIDKLNNIKSILISLNE
jgi:DedD protein